MSHVGIWTHVLDPCVRDMDPSKTKFSGPTHTSQRPNNVWISLAVLHSSTLCPTHKHQWRNWGWEQAAAPGRSRWGAQNCLTKDILWQTNTKVSVIVCWMRLNQPIVTDFAVLQLISASITSLHAILLSGPLCPIGVGKRAQEGVHGRPTPNGWRHFTTSTPRQRKP